MEVKMKKSFFTIGLIFLIVTGIRAQEGMWLLSQIGQLDLNKKGLKLAVSDVYSKDQPAVYNAVVQLGGGTASFVSKEGLLITNHHVAYAAIQRSSSVNSDYLEKGFLAANRSDEIKAPGYRALLLQDMKDVTDEVLSAVKGITDPAEKDKKVTARITEMTEAIRKGKDDVQARIAEMFNGRQYIQFTYKVFKDIRLVYAPPGNIGNYGGETDNWMWPRHTGDFSFFRVYVAPDGTGKEYNIANVPYHPKVWLKVAQEFQKEGDFNFIIGYPGFTTRYRSSTSVWWNENINYPFTVRNFKEIINLMDELTKNNHAGELKVANFKKGLANAMKNNQGKLDGMKKTNFYQKKLDYEKDFVNWANSKPETRMKYADLLAKEKDEYKVLEKTKDRDQVFGLLQGLAGTPLSMAQQVIYVAQQREKSVSDKDPGFDEEMVSQIKENIDNTYANYFEPVDKALMVRALKMANELPRDQRITGVEYIFKDKGGIAQFVDDAFKTSRLTDKDYVKTLFNKTTKELQSLNDPIINLAFSIDPMAEDIQKVNQSFGARVTDLRKVYLEGLYEWKGTGMYPDANGTMRFTSGNVKGYRPADAVWYQPFTTLQGVVDKNRNEDPFEAPKALMDLSAKKDLGKWSDPNLNDVPVAFINQCDITGGNSGSPVMNAKGEIAGVVFDGNYEAMIGDWQYEPSIQRAISVDIHYVLFVTEKFGHAGFLLDEMGVAR